MANWTIYHNPKCSKSRQTLELLNARGIQPAIVEYLKTPPSEDELERIATYLGLAAIDLVRTKETLFKELNLDLDDSGALLHAMANNPKLIERPIVLKDNKGVLGRPPENVENLL